MPCRASPTVFHGYLLKDAILHRMGKMRARENYASVLHFASRQRKPEGAPAVDQKLLQFPSGPGADEGQPPAGMYQGNLSPEPFRGIRKLPDLYQGLRHDGGFLELRCAIESI